MLDYALENLVDGISLPGIILILLLPAFLHFLLTGKRWIFSSLFFFFFLMSLPLSGKLLLYPLEIGVPFGKVKTEELAGKVDAVAVISNGLHRDYLVDASMPNTSSFSRVKRGALLAVELDIPLLLSGTVDKDQGRTDGEILADLVEEKERLYVISGAAGTAEHGANIRKLAADIGAKRLVVFVSGIHAYRTKLTVENEDVSVPVIIVGKRDSSFRKRDLIPSFIGFFYWKHALKEYIGLVYYALNGRLD